MGLNIQRLADGVRDGLDPALVATVGVDPALVATVGVVGDLESLAGPGADLVCLRPQLLGFLRLVGQHVLALNVRHVAQGWGTEILGRLASLEE